MHYELTKFVPILRRYARALSGSQSCADAAVLATLQSLPRQSDSLREEQHREDLYRQFSRIWNGQTGQHIRIFAGRAAAQSEIDQRIAALPSKARQAFLLGAMEDFGDTQIARILDLSPDELALIKARARQIILQQVATDVLIIEDEMFIAGDLEDIMLSLGHNVTGIERTHQDAVAAIARHKPGLILADIQLADGSSGLEAVNEILGRVAVPVVFITAYPERLLTGLRPEPVYVLAKPFKAETVRAITSQALFFDHNAVVRAASLGHGIQARALS